MHRINKLIESNGAESKMYVRTNFFSVVEYFFLIQGFLKLNRVLYFYINKKQDLICS